MKFAILCFDQCSQLPGKNFKSIRDGEKIWKEVTSAVMEPCVNTVLKHLVHGELVSTQVDHLPNLFLLGSLLSYSSYWFSYLS